MSAKFHLLDVRILDFEIVLGTITRTLNLQSKLLICTNRLRGDQNSELQATTALTLRLFMVSKCNCSRYLFKDGICCKRFSTLFSIVTEPFSQVNIIMYDLKWIISIETKLRSNYKLLYTITFWRPGIDNQYLL